MELSRIQWHPAFYSGIEVELRDYSEALDFQQEVELSKKPIRMDMLIIKKMRDVKINHPIGRIFRRENIIEYKGPQDRLSINELFKVVGYACLHKGLSGAKENVPADELTISVFRHAYPDDLMKNLKEMGASVEEREPGIYYVTGIICIPMQIVVISRLEEGAYATLKVLTRNADEEDIRNFILHARSFEEARDRENADAVLQVSVLANRSIYDRLRKESDMCDALRELMKEEIDAEVAKGKKEGKREGIKEGKKEGVLETLSSLVQDGLLNVQEAAKRAGVSESKFKATMKKMYG